MVEIILRKDIQDYEARPLFGFTYRQVATGAAIAITAAGMGLAISSFTEINTLWLMLIMSVCGAIGLVGLGRIHDLKFEQWFAIWKADRDWPKVALFAAPTLSPHGDRASAKAKAGKRPKKETKAEKAAALEADAEAEASRKRRNSHDLPQLQLRARGRHRGVPLLRHALGRARAVCHRHRDHARHPVRAARGACALAGIPS